jgi:hypothetical protein
MHQEGLIYYNGTDGQWFDSGDDTYYAKGEGYNFDTLANDVLSHWMRYGFNGKAFACEDAQDFINAAKMVK